jgi:predicted nucleic-acid-binding Zn-ribbon protein
MNATMNCPKCHSAANGELAGKVGFSGPSGGPLVTPSPERYHFECKHCGNVWYPEAAEIDAP